MAPMFPITPEDATPEQKAERDKFLGGYNKSETSLSDAADNSGPVLMQGMRPADGLNTGAEGSLRWPKKDPITADTDYVSFQFYNYKPPFGRGEGEEISPDIDNNTSLDDASSLYTQYTRTSKFGSGDKAKGYQNIILFMPEDLGSEMTGQWGATSWGLAAKALMETAGTKNLDDIPRALTAGGESLAGGVKIGTYELIMKGINGLTGGSANINQVMGGISGTIINPNVEMMYQSPDLRTFTLNFKMVPRSSEEAAEIKRICTTFRRAMLPSFGGQALGGTVKNNGALLTIPKMVQPTFMSGNSPNEYIPQYKPCVISGVNINYTPDGAWAAYEGGSPVATNLSIDFKETKLIFEQEVNMAGETF